MCHFMSVFPILFESIPILFKGMKLFANYIYIGGPHIMWLVLVICHFVVIPQCLTKLYRILSIMESAIITQCRR